MPYKCKNNCRVFKDDTRYKFCPICGKKLEHFKPEVKKPNEIILTDEEKEIFTISADGKFKEFNPYTFVELSANTPETAEHECSPEVLKLKPECVKKVICEDKIIKFINYYYKYIYNKQNKFTITFAKTRTIIGNDENFVNKNIICTDSRYVLPFYFNYDLPFDFALKIYSMFKNNFEIGFEIEADLKYHLNEIIKTVSGYSEKFRKLPDELHDPIKEKFIKLYEELGTEIKRL